MMFITKLHNNKLYYLLILPVLLLLVVGLIRASHNDIEASTTLTNLQLIGFKQTAGDKQLFVESCYAKQNQHVDLLDYNTSSDTHKHIEADALLLCTINLTNSGNAFTVNMKSVSIDYGNNMFASRGGLTRLNTKKQADFLVHIKDAFSGTIIRSLKNCYVGDGIEGDVPVNHDNLGDFARLQCYNLGNVKRDEDNSVRQFLTIQTPLYYDRMKPAGASVHLNLTLKNKKQYIWEVILPEITTAHYNSSHHTKEKIQTKKDEAKTKACQKLENPYTAIEYRLLGCHQSRLNEAEAILYEAVLDIPWQEQEIY